MLPTNAIFTVAGVSTRSLPQLYLEKCPGGFWKPSRPYIVMAVKKSTSFPVLTKLPLAKGSKHAPLQNISHFPKHKLHLSMEGLIQPLMIHTNFLLHYSALEISLNLISLFFHVPLFYWSNTKRLKKFGRKTDFRPRVLQGTVHLYQSAWLFWLLLYKSHSAFVLTHVTAVVTVQTPIILKTSTQLAWITHSYQAKTPLKVSWRIPWTKNWRISPIFNEMKY